MKSVLLLVAFAVYPCLMFSQAVSYSYDNTGRMTSRQILLSGNKSLRFVMEECVDSVNLMNDVEVFPNPTYGIVNLRGLSMCECLSKVKVLDVSGHELLAKEGICSQMQVDMSDMSKGLYLICVETKVGRYVFEVVKK